VAISLINGEDSNQVALRLRGMSMGASDVHVRTGMGPVQTRQAIAEPAAVLSDSLHKMNARVSTPARNTRAASLAGEDVTQTTPMEQPPTPTRDDVKSVANMITSNSEIAVLAQAHQLPTVTMPFSLDG